MKIANSAGSGGLRRWRNQNVRILTVPHNIARAGISAPASRALWLRAGIARLVHPAADAAISKPPAEPVVVSMRRREIFSIEYLSEISGYGVTALLLIDDWISDVAAEMNVRIRTSRCARWLRFGFPSQIGSRLRRSE